MRLLVLCLIAAAVAGSAAGGDAPRPDLGAEVSGRYIVAFRPEAGPATQAAAALRSHVKSQLQQQPAGPVAAAALQSVHVLHTLGDNAAPQAESSNSLSAAPTAAAHAGGAAAAAAVPSTGLQAVVMQISHPVALASVRSAISVAAVIPDRVVAAQQDPPAACIDPQQLSLGLAAAEVAKPFVWRSCLTAKTELRWIGERCGPNMDQISYAAVYAVLKNSTLIARAAGEDCILTPNATATPLWNRLRFGGCGTPPLYAPKLPTCLQASAAAAANGLNGQQSPDGSDSGSSCIAAAEAASPASRFTVSATLSTPVRCGARSVRTVVYHGTPCGPDKQFVAWFRAVGAGGCHIIWRTGQVKYNNDVFGSCGIPPGIPLTNQQVLPTVMCSAPPSPSPSPDVSPSPSPSPSPEAPVDISPSPAPSQEPSSPSPQPPPDAVSPSPSPDPATPRPPGTLPRIAVEAGDSVPTGVLRIEAATAAGVVNTAGLPVDRQVTVAVMDSGVDGTHPDLNYVGGLSWISASAGRPRDGAADYDGFGHGTHVAGIIGARNNGVGVVGVAPGVPVYSLKVLDGDGRGMLSTVMSAVKWVAAVGVTQGIKVINISLSAFIDPSSPDYQTTMQLVCSVFAEATDAGVVIVVAAGNYGASIKGYLPGGCPSVAVVTAIDADGVAAAGYSNYMPVNSAPLDLNRVVAAPGSFIRSTLPVSVDESGYGIMSGTSMAAPHVAGVAANCVMSGACSASSGIDRLATVQATARQRYLQNSLKRYGFSGDAYSTAGGQYYGLLVWSAGF